MATAIGDDDRSLDAGLFPSRISRPRLFPDANQPPGQVRVTWPWSLTLHHMPQGTSSKQEHDTGEVQPAGNGKQSYEFGMPPTSETESKQYCEATSQKAVPQEKVPCGGAQPPAPTSCPPLFAAHALPVSSPAQVHTGS